MRVTGFYLSLPSELWFLWAVCVFFHLFTGFSSVVMGYGTFDWVLMGLTVFNLVKLSFSGFQWV